MPQACCPTCHRPLPKPRTAKPAAPVASVDTSALTVDELRAFYKRIGTREDARFWLRHADHIPQDVRAECELLIAELETRDGKPADAKRLEALKRQAEPHYRQVCGHRHHTSMRTAVACKLGMIATCPDFGTVSTFTPEQNDVIDQVLGWES